MARRLVGVRVERQLVTVPVAGPTGCVEFAADDCCGSGSGSGSGGGDCTLDCDFCSGGMSAVWELSVDGYDPVFLYHDPEGMGGTNYCTFDSTDLVWRMQYDYEDDIWLVTNSSTAAVWFLTGASWSCLAENILEPVSVGDGNAAVVPVNDCTEVSYNCVSGGCVAVAGTGGTYATLAECQAACAGGGSDVVTACTPSVAKQNMTATVVGRGNCACYSGVYPITHTSNVPPTWVSTSAPGTCSGVTPSLVLICSGGNWIARIECPSGSLSLFQSGPDATTTTPFGLTFNGGGAGISNSGGSTCCTDGITSITITS